MRRIVAQARKELTQIVRDWRTMALALALPVFLLVLMSNALSLTVNELPIVVQDFDGSTASNDFIDAFRASITLHVVSWPVDKTAEAALASNAARAVLIIPSHFGRDMARGVNAPVQFMVDASDANTAKLVSAYASQITERLRPAGRWSASSTDTDRHSALVQPRALFDEVLRSWDIRAWHLHVPASAGRACHGERG